MKHSNPLTLVVIVAVLVTFLLGCQYFLLPEHLQSEAALENPRSTIPDASVLLNAEDMGKISDIGRQVNIGSIALESQTIDRRLAEIIKEREETGVLLEGTNVVPSNVYLFANPNLEVGAFAKLYLAIDQAAGIVYIPRNASPDAPDEPQRPDPLTLIVRTEMEQMDRTKIPFVWPIYDPELRYSYDIEVEIALSADQLKSTRRWEDSLEISADERFFINEKQGSDADYGPKNSRVKQRAVEEAQIKDELNRLPTSADRKLIIVSEKAAYGTLLHILEQVNEPRTKFRIVVRPNVYPQK